MAGEQSQHTECTGCLVLLACVGRVTALESLIGKLPTAVDPGAGLAQLVAQLSGKIDVLTSELKRREDRASRFNRLVWIALAAVTALAVSAAWHWLFTLRH